VQVRHDEGVAIHIDPEPCAVVRKGDSEASVGERIGTRSTRKTSSGSRTGSDRSAVSMMRWMLWWSGSPPKR